MKILTQNCWGVPKKERKKRFDIIADIIRNRPYDIVCLQEVFLRRWHRQSFAGLESYHHSYQEGIISLKGGLLTLTKQPPKEVAFHRYEAQGNWFSQQITDRILGKGFLETIIEDDGEDLAVINVHNVSIYKPHYSQKMHLLAQAEQLLEYVQKKTENGQKVIVAGDFNFERGSNLYRNFAIMLNDLTSSPGTFDWFEYDQIDFIFANCRNTEKAAYVGHLGRCPSDHPGLYADLEL